MKLLSFAPLLAVATSSQNSLDQWVIDNLDLSCGFDSDTELSFDVYPGDSVLDEEHFRAGECGSGQLQITQAAINTTLPADQAAKGKKKYTIRYNAQTCMGTVGNKTDLQSYASNITFGLDFGYSYQGTFMHFKTYNIPAICKFQSSYSLKYDFGAITAPDCTGSDCILGPVTGGIDFDLDLYRDSNHTNELFNSTVRVKPTDIVYFTISPKFDMPAELQFSPPKCRFLQETCDANDNCNVHNEFDLFDYEENNCNKGTLDSPLNFQLSYSTTENQWHSQFRVFLFSGDVGASSYTLRCDVNVCVAACGAADAVGDQKCQSIASSCLSDSNYLEFNDQCIQCGAGQQPNDAGDSCEDCPENTYNDNSASISSCRACASGLFSAAGAVACCPSGKSWNSDTSVCESTAVVISNTTTYTMTHHPNHRYWTGVKPNETPVIKQYWSGQQVAFDDDYYYVPGRGKCGNDTAPDCEHPGLKYANVIQFRISDNRIMKIYRPDDTTGLYQGYYGVAVSDNFIIASYQKNHGSAKAALLVWNKATGENTAREPFQNNIGNYEQNPDTLCLHGNTLLVSNVYRNSPVPTTFYTLNDNGTLTQIFETQPMLASKVVAADDNRYYISRYNPSSNKAELLAMDHSTFEVEKIYSYNETLRHHRGRGFEPESLNIQDDLILTCGWDGCVDLTNKTTGERIGFFNFRDEANIQGADFQDVHCTMGGNYIFAFQNRDKHIWIWSLEDFKNNIITPIKRIEVTYPRRDDFSFNACYGFEYSEKHRKLVVGCAGGDVFAYDF